jgi:UDP-hydrolysing UDP-N-acetyl-D-glucosamine 2-epimerase
MKKKICVVITNRTNYSKLKLILAELKSYEFLEVEIVASSSILLGKYGTPYQDIENDGYKIAMKIDCVLMNDTHEAMITTVGLSMIQHAVYLTSSKPDIVLVVGDRFDALPPALAAAMMNIPIAHIQGGETSGTIDDKVRDLISKISTLHFVATEMSRERLIQWGIDSASILNYGCPAVEYITKIDVGNHFDRASIKKEFKRPIIIGPNEKYFLVVVHPDTTNEYDVSMETVLRAVESFNLKTFVFYPNVDANNSKILMDIEKFKKNEKFYMIRHMPLEGFIHTMAHSCCMLGNSSSGIREAASFGVPVINIGNRQNGRERNHNVKDVPCDYNELVRVIGSVMDKRFEKKNIYYKPDCSKSIAKEIVNFLESSMIKKRIGL